MAVVVLAGLAFTAIAVFLTFALLGLLVKLLIRVILLPLLLLKWLVTGIVMLVVGPILFVAGLFACLALGVALALPLLPLAAVGAVVWMVVRANRRPAVA